MFGAFADPGSITVKPGTTETTALRLYATGEMPDFKLAAFAGNSDLKATLSANTGNDGDIVTLTVTAASSYYETQGQNLVYIYSATKDYVTRRVLIVHAK
jgi:hypothetical protein